MFSCVSIEVKHRAGPAPSVFNARMLSNGGRVELWVWKRHEDQWKEPLKGRDEGDRSQKRLAKLQFDSGKKLKLLFP